MSKDPSQQEVVDVLKTFGVTPEQGLGEDAVTKQRELHGANKLDEAEKKSILTMVLEQFEDKLVRILLVSAVISFLMAFFDGASEHEGLAAYVEPFVILTILALNAVVGVYQEAKADKALDALKEMSASKAFVTRAGSWVEIEAVDLVPGDIVQVATGDQVPADIRVIQLTTTTLSIEQAALTGESVSVKKDPKIVDPTKSLVLQDKTNMLFSGTAVSSGKAVGVVTQIGMQTEMGKISKGVQEAEDEQTPLQEKLEEFGDKLSWIILFICIAVWAVNFNHFFDPSHGHWMRGCMYYFKIAVALAVAAIPEGLPTVITMCLAIGTQKMAKKNAIVRKLPSVETLGCTTVICSDKTGTLTTNEMTVVQVCLPSSDKMETFGVSGIGYDPVGGKFDMNYKWGAQHKNLDMVGKCGSLCNESRFTIEAGKVKRNGEPTEAAIRTFVEKLGCPDATLEAEVFGDDSRKKQRTAQTVSAFSDYWKKGLERLTVLEFNRDRKSMSSLYHNAEKKENELFVKGASEIILSRCDRIMLPSGDIVKFDAAPGMKNDAAAKIEDMAKNALRTIGLAYKPGGELKTVKFTCDEKEKQCDLSTKTCVKDEIEFFSDTANFVEAERDMIFLGILGIKDPPREECKEAIKICNGAGITVIMITGDNKATAEAIATELGILIPGQDHKGRCFTGKEFEEMSAKKKTATLQNIMATKELGGAVFARTEPLHKQQIVKILKDLKEISAMTGDGVNDAPALKEAAIGIAMGITGTAVAKDAAAMVLQDDNFASIVAAVEEGRSIYSNMKAFIRYMISSNVGEVAAIFFTAALGIPEGLTPVQLLWVNLVTDGPPATALGLNPPDMDAMKKPPRRRDDSLISTRSYVRYLVVGFYVGFAVVGIFIYWFCYDSMAGDNHPLVDFSQLLEWSKCNEWDATTKAKIAGNLNLAGFSGYATPTIQIKECTDYFTDGKVKASSLSLTVLVVIEMLNAFNALSEDGSLLHMPPWSNPILILMTALSVGIHMVVLYLPMANRIFEVVPLSGHDWVMVLAFSMPVLLIDEILKFFGRRTPEFLAATTLHDAGAVKDKDA
jgi:Ca2+-transporting ATPase